MTRFTCNILLVCTLLAAVLFYVKGSVAGSVIFITIGVLLELAFWVGLVAKKR